MSNANTLSLESVRLTKSLNQLITGKNTTTATVTAPIPSAVLTMPNTTDTLIGRETVDTLTQKTLVAPVLVNPIWTNGTGNYTLPTVTSNLLAADHGTVTQASSITTAVTLNTMSGIITTVSFSLNSGVSTPITLNNSNISATSNIWVSIVNFTGDYNSGLPIVAVSNVANGSAVIQLTNVSDSDLAPSTVKIQFLIG